MEFAFLVSPFTGSAFIALFRTLRRAAVVVLVTWAGASLAHVGPAESAASGGHTEAGNVWQRLTEWFADLQPPSLHFGTACTPIARLPDMPAAIAGPVASPMLLAPLACDLLDDTGPDATSTAPVIVSMGPTVAALHKELRWQMSYNAAAERGGILASDVVVAFESPESPATATADCMLDGGCGTRAASPSNGAERLAGARLSAGTTRRASARTILGHVLWLTILILLAVTAGWALRIWFRYDKSLLRAARAGLRRGEFHVEYQPVFGVRRARCVGIEALLRWDNQKYGALGPAHYMEFIENTSLIGPMTRFVLSSAARDLREIGASKSLYLGVTAPSSYLLSSAFTADLADVGSLGLPPLILKVSASSVRRFKKRLIPVMAQAREKGVRFALSVARHPDCGLALPPDIRFELVKIDRAVLGLDPDERARQLDALTRMGHDLGAAVVVEGIENSTHHDVARASRAEFGQGFFYSRALGASRLKGFLETANAPPSSNRAGAATVLGWRVRNF